MAETVDPVEHQPVAGVGIVGMSIRPDRSPLHASIGPGDLPAPWARMTDKGADGWRIATPKITLPVLQVVTMRHEVHS